MEHYSSTNSIRSGKRCKVYQIQAANWDDLLENTRKLAELSEARKKLRDSSKMLSESWREFHRLERAAENERTLLLKTLVSPEDVRGRAV